MKWRIGTLACLMLISQAFFAQDSINEIIRVAKAGYMDYLSQIPAGSEGKYGFRNREEFQRVSVGRPYSLCTVPDDFLSDSWTAQRGQLKFLNEYRVPLIVGKENRALLTVAKMNGIWQVVDLGAAQLAAELGENEKQFPASGNSGMILRIFRLYSDFLVSGAGNDLKSITLYPLESAKMAIGAERLGSAPISVNTLHDLTRDLLKNKSGQQ